MTASVESEDHGQKSVTQEGRKRWGRSVSVAMPPNFYDDDDQSVASSGIWDKLFNSTFPYNSCCRMNRFLCFKIRLSIMLAIAMCTQALVAPIYGGWQHWLLLLRGDGVIREGCTGDTYQEIDACEEASLSQLYLFASMADNTNALVAGIMLDTTGSYPLLCLSWTYQFIAATTLILGSAYRVSSLSLWRFGFFMLGANTTCFSFGFADLSNRFPPKWRYTVMNIIMVMQVTSTVVMNGIYEVWKLIDEPPLWHVLLGYYLCIGLPLFVLFLFIFDNQPSIDPDDVSIVTGSQINPLRSFYFPSLLSYEMGNLSQCYNSHLPAEGLEVHSGDPGSMDSLAVPKPLDDATGPIMIDGQFLPAHTTYENVAPTVAPNTQSPDVSPSQPPRNSGGGGIAGLDDDDDEFDFETDGKGPLRPSFKKYFLRPIVTQCQKLRFVEVSIIVFIYYVPQVLSKENYWVTLQRKTGDFSTKFSAKYPIFAITAAFTGGPTYESCPPYSIFSVMVVVSACFAWANISTIWNDNAYVLWAGGILYAMTTSLVYTSRFCYLQWFLKKDYGTIAGLASCVAGLLVPFLSLQNTHEIFGKTYDIFFRYILFPVTASCILFLAIKHMHDVKKGKVMSDDSSSSYAGTLQINWTGETPDTIVPGGEVQYESMESEIRAPEIL